MIRVMLESKLSTALDSLGSDYSYEDVNNLVDYLGTDEDPYDITNEIFKFLGGESCNGIDSEEFYEVYEPDEYESDVESYFEGIIEASENNNSGMLVTSDNGFVNGLVYDGTKYIVLKISDEDDNYLFW